MGIYGHIQLYIHAFKCILKFKIHVFTLFHLLACLFVHKHTSIHMQMHNQVCFSLHLALFYINKPREIYYCYIFGKKGTQQRTASTILVDRLGKLDPLVRARGIIRSLEYSPIQKNYKQILQSWYQQPIMECINPAGKLARKQLIIKCQVLFE